MNFIKSIFIIILFFAFNLLSAKEVNLKKAKLVADNFYISYNENSKVIWDGIELFKTADKTDFYVFNSKLNNAFIIVAGEDKVKPIIAYSFDNTFKKDKISPALQYFINGYQKDISELRLSNHPQNTKVAEIWNDYLNKRIQDSKLASVSPLIQTEWGQGCFYNSSCPFDNNGVCNRALVGCVATAMAQIIKYHEFPSVGYGSHSYNHPNYGNLSVDFSSSSYNYNDMPNTLNYYTSSAQVQAVADLMFHCGVGVEMNYGPNSSGSNNSFARDAFVDFFNYKSIANIEYAQNYATVNWINKIKNNLNDGLPVLYGANDITTNLGHAFVIDGYQGISNFHVNWGWEGSNDGYYNLANLNPSYHSFNTGHEAIFDLMPATGCSSNLTTLTSNTGTIGDGSGHENYNSNISCEWLISPQSGNVVSLFFEELNTEAGSDEIKVYDGTNSNGNLLLNTSGNNLPGVVTATSGNMYITFTTNSSNNKPGWNARWEDNYPVFCNSGKVINSPFKYISDGSGPSNYLNNSNCSWIIMPSGANFIGIDFQYMDIHSSDHLNIYDGPSVNFPLLGSYNGNTVPNSIQSTNSRIYIEFITNSLNNAGGWALSYYQNSQTDINEIDIIEVKTYPNPVNSEVVLEINGKLKEEFDIIIYNNIGQKLIFNSFNKNLSTFKKSIDVSNLKPGIYFMKIYFGNEAISRKIIIE